ncbi:MAG: methylmalonyl Co-A mutase-associated GTPase MeaB [Halioglobus sp.]|nr:methylmalonyl Co-A mutase-associated GTPase MeaB [Halioglobus sp.]
MEQLAAALGAGERPAIATALNLIDDNRAQAREQATALLDLIIEPDGAANHLVGLTGPPGVGKSSLTAALIDVWRGRDLRVGILAVDPSSPVSGGALLGDRLRMKTDPVDDGVFVRSLSSRGQFGGLSTEVWPMCLVMLYCFDVVLVETVGVGQREADIAHSCDTTCFVAQPGSGDSVQFLKAGVLEVPHILVVNKQDMGAVATRTLSELASSVQGEHPDGNWNVPVLATSATQRTGIVELADTLQAHHRQLADSGDLQARRRRYQAHWLLKRLEENYGRAGLRQLGGADALLAELCDQPGNPLVQYAQYQHRLSAARPPAD